MINKYWFFETEIGWATGRLACRWLGIPNVTCRGNYHCYVRHLLRGGKR